MAEGEGAFEGILDSLFLSDSPTISLTPGESFVISGLGAIKLGERNLLCLSCGL